MKKDYISTIEAAKFFRVSRPTMRKWVDNGSIEAYITPGGTARISVASLIHTMKERNIPVPLELISLIAYKILVVDDEKEQLILISSILSDSKYAVDTADNGYKACIKMGDFKPELIIIDIMMPLMNGVELYKEIKKNSITKDCKVLVITGHPKCREIEQLRSLGLDEFIYKPFKPHELTATITRMLNIKDKKAAQ